MQGISIWDAWKSLIHISVRSSLTTPTSFVNLSWAQKKNDFNFSLNSLTLRLWKATPSALADYDALIWVHFACSFSSAENGSQVSCARTFRAEKKMSNSQRNKHCVSIVRSADKNVPELKLWNAFKCRLLTKTWRHSLSLYSSVRKKNANKWT